MAELHVHITVRLDGDVWEHEHEVTVPPDYKRQDIEPFILHEMRQGDERAAARGVRRSRARRRSSASSTGA